MLYLIETANNGRGNALEYKMIEAKKDMRKRFCKENKDSIINTIELITLISKYKIQIKDNRVIMPSGEVGYKFGRELKQYKEKK